MASTDSSQGSTTSKAEPIIDHNPGLQSYYQSLESRIGYRLVLGGTRHFGYWERDTHWPFPVSKSLRRMEDKLAERLGLPEGSRLLDAGCGVGHVALTMATKYKHHVTGIDVVEHHFEKARRNAARAKLPEGQMTVRRMDYHHLESIESETYDGIYTMETFVHATDPDAVLRGFHRLLKPGGRVALFEYDNTCTSEAKSPFANDMTFINEVTAMPTNQISRPGTIQRMLEDAGFADVEVQDISENIKPMARLFFALAIVPYLIIWPLGLRRHFINTMGGVGTYWGLGSWRYVTITATKPKEAVELPKTG